jgi:hypothetical protein
MKHWPEYLAIGIWCLFVTAIAIVDDKTHVPGPLVAQNAATLAKVANATSGDLVTGRSSAYTKTSSNPYGELFFDPSFQNEPPALDGPKPTSADLIAK